MKTSADLSGMTNKYFFLQMFRLKDYKAVRCALCMLYLRIRSNMENANGSTNLQSDFHHVVFQPFSRRI